MKRVLVFVVLLALAMTIVLMPEIGLSEDDETLLLARAMYAMGKDQSYDTLLALGSVVMNRVESPWFPDTITGVLTQPQQFPYGSRYDERTLRAAREILSGKRTLDADVVYCSALDATARRNVLSASAVIGNYGFYVNKA